MVPINGSIEGDDPALSDANDGHFGDPYPLPIEILMSTIVWLMCFLAVFGNLFVFILIFRDKQLRSDVANIYILNLASADFCVGLVSLTMKNIWRYTGNWPFQRAGCVFWTIVDYSACFQAALAVTLISFDRYFMVSKVLEYRKHQSKKMAWILIAFTWTISLTFFALPTLANEHREPGNSSIVKCQLGVFYILQYNIAQIVVGFILPTFIMAHFNFKVYSNILRRSKRLIPTAMAPSSDHHRAARKVGSRRVGASVNITRSALDTKKIYKKHRKAAISLAVIVGMFLLGWIPYYVVQFLFITNKVEFDSLVWNAVFYTVWANSAINPFIYAATKPRIRQGFRKTLCAWNCRIFRKIRPIH